VTTTSRTRIGWQSWVWIVWRQHRTGLLAIAGLALSASLFLLLNPIGSPMGTIGTYYVLWWKPQVPTMVAAAVATFWAAPLLAREHDNSTHLFAWTQDATPRRWLVSKAIVLAVPAVVLTVIADLAVLSMLHPEDKTRFTAVSFESNVFVAVAYTLFGMALGLACSALFRQSLLAAGVTFIVFLAFRMFFARIVRPHLVPSVDSFRAWDPPGVQYEFQVPPGALRIDSGYADGSHNPVSLSEQDSYTCAYSGDTTGQTECLKGKGVAGHFAEFQPFSRMPVLQFLEIVVYLALTAALIWFTLRWVNQRRRV
jgi:hypothetical protein